MRIWKTVFSIIILLIGAAMGILVTACSKKADPIVLPDENTINSVDITAGDETVNRSEDDWITRFVSAVSDAEATRKQSVQDIPDADGCIRIDINCGDSITTLFMYEENEKYYIEQPYQGIYQSDADFFETLTALE